MILFLLNILRTWRFYRMKSPAAGLESDSLTILVNSFLADCDFSCLLITFANSLDPDQDRQNIGPCLDLNNFIMFLKDFL